MDINLIKTIMLALLALWAALLFGGFALGRGQEGRRGRMPLWTRLASSLVLVAAAWFWAAADPAPYSRLALWLAVGMSLGFVGDLFMARLIIRGEYYVLGGIGAFGVGHVAYMAGLLDHAAAYDPAPPLLPALAGWLLAGAALWYVVVWRGSEGTVLHRAALPYALLLAGTAGLGSGLALVDAMFWPLALGAVLFLTSDLILAARLFNGLDFPLVDDVVWLTYGPGQMLIVYAAALALLL